MGDATTTAHNVDFTLPTKKRNHSRNLVDAFLLPTKKRAYAPPPPPPLNSTTILEDAWRASQHYDYTLPASSPSAFSLPTKKRVWANFQPDSVSSHLYEPPLTHSHHHYMPEEETQNVEFSDPAKEYVFQHEVKISEEKQAVADCAVDGGSGHDHLQQLASSADARSIQKAADIHATSVHTQLQHANQVTTTTTTTTTTANCDGGECESEDGIMCEICRSTDGDPSDPIVFCDGCDLMVHATCYGNPLIEGIPDGDWFCHKCAFEAETPVSCCLCPSSGGALKPTNDGRWAHIVCAFYVPEVFFVDSKGRDGIDVSKICGKLRWNRKCYVCEKRKGCVVHCSEAKCTLSFHVTCGLNQDLCIEYRQGKMKKGGIVAGFCEDHTQLWKKQQHTGKFKIVAREER